MKAVVQRVSWARVEVDGSLVGAIEKGLLVLAAANRLDTEDEAEKLADRVWGLRVFNDAEGKINLSLKDLVSNGDQVGVLAVSNFTVYGETAKNRRPSFTESAPYEKGLALFAKFVEELKKLGCSVATGEFGADMKVSLLNDGPVTVILEVEPKGTVEA